eukprot:3491280-Rhodomonas_salina.3
MAYDTIFPRTYYAISHRRGYLPTRSPVLTCSALATTRMISGRCRRLPNCTCRITASNMCRKRSKVYRR